MKSYILCCVDQVIFHSGLPHFRGGCGVSGSGKYRRLFRQTDPRYVLSSIFRMKTRPKQGKPYMKNLAPGPKCPLSGPPDNSASTVDSPGEREREILNEQYVDLTLLRVRVWSEWNLGMFEFQLGQLHQVLSERCYSPCLEIYQFWMKREH